MILPPGHARQVREHHTVRSRERVMVGGVIVALVAIAVVLVISFATAGKRSGHGCISVSLPYSTGGAQIYRCGAGARSLCAGVNRPGLTGAAGQIVARACRRAGVAVG